MNTALDLAFARAQFPAFEQPTLRDQAFFENAGGSFACRPVINRLTEYYQRLKVQPYYPYPAAQEAGEWMDASHERLAEYLGVDSDAIHFGPSTSQNTYVLAQALRAQLKTDDEIIISGQEHQANRGAWQRLAEFGVVIREWPIDPVSGLLDLNALDALLNERTRAVAITHSSNIIGAINPIAAITAKVRAAGALSIVDGVAAAPHALPDVRALGADIYLFSLYKTFGPHQGLMVIAPALLNQLANQGHVFNADQPRKRLIPAGPDHAQVAAARGIAEYFDALDAHHGGGDPSQRAQRVRALLSHAEHTAIATLQDYFLQHPKLRLIGPTDTAQRAGLFSVVPQNAEPLSLVPKLARHGVLAGAGHFYAVSVLQALGIDPARGVLRFSLAHYTSAADVDRLITALDTVLEAT